MRILVTTNTPTSIYSATSPEIMTETSAQHNVVSMYDIMKSCTTYVHREYYKKEWKVIISNNPSLPPCSLTARWSNVDLDFCRLRLCLVSEIERKYN